MTEKLNDVISRVVVDTFEKLAFMFAFPEEGKGTEPSGDLVRAGVSFLGPFSGQVVICISSVVLPELGANMLGMDDEAGVTLENQHDALKEAINVICGNLLPAIAGEEPVFNMDMPRILSLNDIPSGDHLARVRLEFDDGHCEVMVHLDGQIPEEITNQIAL